MLEIMFYDGWRWGLVLQRCLVRSSGVLSREGCRRGSRDLSPPLQLTMLWNLCVDMTSSGAPVLDRLMTIGRRSRRVVG